ncbi:MAG: sodium-dependent transporter [Lachnoclostridium sp.]|nr:sodium-dependent transporter [Lachnoclostridium sp.]
MQENNRAVFATKFGAIAATVGSAVGLGNIWRFPYEAGEHGGGAFLICYIAFVFLLGVPVLCAEFCMGRASRSNIFGAYRKLSNSKGWKFAGFIGILASLLILSFYSVVAGWTVEYCLSSLTGQLDFSDSAAVHRQFEAMTTGWRPVIWTVIFLICNFLILFGGVTKGIERASNILMPLLFLLLVAFCINSLTMPAFKEGMAFLFKPDFSKIDASVMLGAMGQAFFSLSLGLGGMMTYASYFSNETRLVRSAVTTASLDFLVAVIAGIIIFPAVFSFDISPQAGPTLVFEVLPFIFSHLPLGIVWSTLFFLLLFVASITSTVSMSEISITYFCEEKKMSRPRATIISSAIALVGGLICALSFGPLSDFYIFGMTVFDLFDYASSNILLPIGGMICSWFVGWKMDRRLLKMELTNNGTFKTHIIKPLRFFLRYICPTAIFLILLSIN